MDNLITPAYFNGLIELPDSQVIAAIDTPSGEAVTTQTTRLEMEITEYQEELLTRLFGSNVLPTECESLMVRANILKSPIADFSYCNLIHEYQSNSSESGEKIHNAVDSIAVNYSEKYNLVWNRMVKECRKMRLALYDAGKYDTYPTDDDDEIYILKSFI